LDNLEKSQRSKIIGQFLIIFILTENIGQIIKVEVFWLLPTNPGALSHMKENKYVGKNSFKALLNVRGY
jgi:hypothetical protein